MKDFSIVIERRGGSVPVRETGIAFEESRHRRVFGLTLEEARSRAARESRRPEVVTVWILRGPEILEEVPGEANLDARTVYRHPEFRYLSISFTPDSGSYWVVDARYDDSSVPFDSLEYATLEEAKVELNCYAIESEFYFTG